MDIVSGAEKKPDYIFEVRLPGQVTVQLNTKQGVWCVWLGGKPYATEQGPA
jgi:hypothetical protein